MNVEILKQRLQQMERELASRVGEERVNGRDAGDGGRDAGDESREDELTDEQIAAVASDRTLLTEVRAALGRIEAGTYGLCVVDGGPIEEKRLEAIPWTPYCLKHEQLLEGPARRRTTL